MTVKLVCFEQRELLGSQLHEVSMEQGLVSMGLPSLHQLELTSGPVHSQRPMEFAKELAVLRLAILGLPSSSLGFGLGDSAHS